MPARAAELADRNPQWTALCDSLLNFTIGRNSRLANGVWQRTYIAIVPEQWGMPALASHLARTGAIAADFPALNPIVSVAGHGFHEFATRAGIPGYNHRESQAFEAVEGGGFGLLVVDSVLSEYSSAD